MKTTKTQYNLPRGNDKKLEALKNFFYEKYGDKYSGNDTNEKNYRFFRICILAALNMRIINYPYIVFCENKLIP